MNESARVREAMRRDAAELEAVWRTVVRSADDVAAAMIAAYEAETGLRATDEDWAAARSAAVPQPEEPRP